MVAILEKSDAAGGFEQIIDFLSGSYINHALTVNPHVYISCIKQFWNTAVVKRSGDVTRVGKGFSGVETTLFETMLAVRDIAEEAEAQVPAQGNDVHEHAAEEVATGVVPPTPTSPSPSSPVIPSLPPYQSPCPPQQQDAEGSSQLFQQVLDTCSALVLRVEDDVENVFNQGRISVDIDQDEGIELVVDHEKDAEVKWRHADKQAEIYNIDLDHYSKVLSMQEDDTEVVTASTPISAAKPKILKIAAAPAVSTRRRKGVVIRDPEEELHTDTLAETLTVKDKGKGILIEDPKPMKKKDQVEMDAEFDANMKFLFKTREEMEEEDEEIIKSINETPAQKATKRRKLSEEAQEADDLRRNLEIIQDKDDDVFVEAIPLAQKVPVVDYQVVVIDKKPKYKIIRVDDTHQFYISFTTLLKNFDREDLETLWRIDVIWRNQKSVHGLALVKRWKLLTSCGVHVIILSTVQLFLLVERRYPLSRFTLEQLVNVARLQVEEESEMSLELLRFTRQQLLEYQQG
nr:hypothetical protein [Tanacetum cinerariifolium]